MWYFFLFLTLKCVFTYEIVAGSFAVTDQCMDICRENQLPALDMENYEQVVCQSGCKFFNIIHFKDELTLNGTKKECHLSCNESYVIAKENEICSKGCDLMAQKRYTEMSAFVILTEEEDDSSSGNIVLAEPDLEVLESDILSDPSIKSQLEIGFSIDYKIPETHIRTMPIKFRDESAESKDGAASGDWLDCASRNSGIPRWILLSAILSAVLIALWLSFSSERRSSEELAEVDISDEKLILANEEKDPELLLGLNQNHKQQDYAAAAAGGRNISPPPKYTMETEKV